MEGFARLDHINLLIREAAECARAYLQQTDPTHPTIYSQTLSTISRVIWTQNTELAKSMLQRDVVAEHFMEFLRAKSFSRTMKNFRPKLRTPNLRFWIPGDRL